MRLPLRHLPGVLRISKLGAHSELQMHCTVALAITLLSTGITVQMKTKMLMKMKTAMATTRGSQVVGSTAQLVERTGCREVGAMWV